jgi:hypothetical protein
MERIRAEGGANLEEFFRRLTSQQDLSAVAGDFLKSLREGPG